MPLNAVHFDIDGATPAAIDGFALPAPLPVPGETDFQATMAQPAFDDAPPHEVVDVAFRQDGVHQRIAVAGVDISDYVRSVSFSVEAHEIAQSTVTLVGQSFECRMPARVTLRVETLYPGHEVVVSRDGDTWRYQCRPIPPEPMIDPGVRAVSLKEDL